MTLGRQSIGARHPNLDWIYLIGPTALEHTLGRLWNVPYYGRSLTIKIVRVADLSSRLHNRILTWDARRDNWSQLPPRPTQARKIETMSKATTTKTTKAATTAEGITKADLVPSYTQDGKTRMIGFVLLCVSIAFRFLAGNKANRAVHWLHIGNLIKSFRSENNSTWIGEASTFVLDWLGITADGQHRMIAYILAFGNKEDIRRLLEMIASWPNSGYFFNSKECNDVEAEVASKIKGYTIWTKSEPTLYVPMIINANPEVAKVSGIDERHRTGADQLVMDPKTSNMLSKWDLPAKELQETLRYIYNRVLPPSKNTDSYGSVRRGGAIHPDRYPVMAKHFQSYIEQAMEAIHGDKGVGYSSDSWPMSHAQLLATVALAIQGGKTVAQVQKVLREWMLTDGGCPLVKALWKGKTDKTITPHQPPYVLAYCINEGATPKDIATPSAVLGMIGGDAFEQQPANRLPGWDSTGCADIVSASLAKKIKARDKAKTTKAK